MTEKASMVGALRERDPRHDEIDRLIEHRARTPTDKEEANREAEAWSESARAHHSRIRNRNRWEWIRFFERMAQSHARLSEDYQRRADELCGETTEGR